MMTTKNALLRRYAIEAAQKKNSERWSHVPFVGDNLADTKAQLLSWVSTFVGSNRAYKMKYDTLQKMWTSSAYLAATIAYNTADNLPKNMDDVYREEKEVPRGDSVENKDTGVDLEVELPKEETWINKYHNLRAAIHNRKWVASPGVATELKSLTKEYGWSFDVNDIIRDQNNLVEEVVSLERERDKLRIEISERPKFELTYSDAEWVEPSYFKRLGIYMKAGRTVALVGPAGTGKTSAAIAAAKALGFVPYEADVTHHTLPEHLVGRVGFNGKEDIFRPGICALALQDPKGCIILNEWDAANPTTAMALQSLFERRNPKTLSAMDSDKIRIKAEGTCPIILTMNTLGDGPNRQYVGRNRLDYATMDRISIINCGYENEDKILASRKFNEPNIKRIINWTTKAREVIASKNLPIVLSTRRLLDIGEAVENFGSTVSEAIEQEFLARLQPEDAKLLRGIGL